MPNLQTYRTVGPFDGESLPGGLRRTHRLKPGAWGQLTVHSGTIRLHWDDMDGGEEGASVLLGPGPPTLVPPERPHHLEEIGPFSLSIAFQREVGG